MWLFQPFKYHNTKNYGNKGMNKHYSIRKNVTLQKSNCLQ